MQCPRALDLDEHLSDTDTAAQKSLKGAVRLKVGLNTLIVSVRPRRFRELVGN